VAIDEMKAKIADKGGPKGYTPAAYTAAMEAGTVDISMLADSLSYSDDAKKLGVQLTQEVAKMKKLMAEPLAKDFSSYEGKIDADVLAQVEAIYCAEMPKMMSEFEKAMTEKADLLTKELNVAFSGPGGLVEKSSKHDAEAEAGMLQSVAEMEKLLVDASDVSTVTIAEILEREPELRAKVEDEIKNHVWAP
jgi:hypothetical protein